MSDGLTVIDNTFELAKMATVVGSPVLFFDFFKDNQVSMSVLLTTQVILIGLTYYGVVKSAWVASSNKKLII